MPPQARKAVYPGTFDPVTLGHIDIIERSLKLFDEVIVGVTTHPAKSAMFPIDERVKLVAANTKQWKNVQVKKFDSLVVDFARQEGAAAIIRGLRELSDFQDEFQYAIANRKLAPAIETVFIMTDAKHFYLSSSLVKEVARFGGPLECLVPANVEQALRNRFSKTL